MVDRLRKKTVGDLAVCGGLAAFAEPLHVGRPNIPDTETFLAHARDILDRQWLTNNGPYVQELEHRLCTWLGVKHCIPVCNGTIALELALRAAGIDQEVVVPSFTFVGTAHALAWQRIRPVFCDVNAATHLLDVESVERAITPRTTAILAVHLWGQPCYSEALDKVARKHGLRLIFDAAHALGCSHSGIMVGNFGDAEVFSFHATKFFNTFEGGAIATNDDNLAGEIRLMLNFGFAGYDNSVLVGTNGKLSEIGAAMGIACFDGLGGIVAANRANYHRYDQALSDLPGIALIQYDKSEERNFQYVVVDAAPHVCPLTRDELLHVLWLENILARRYFYPGCHRMPCYSTDDHLPGTDRAAQGVLVLPTGTAIGECQVEAICEIIACAISNYQAVRSALAGCIPPF
jgi:dTDP-4-amino-4,6-dideoxygalactose transaminase